ncbi:retention module-containing protein [Ectopseudomonas oleovorans]|uniref:retention module-containing protein n=1 Tax=Ectopseudomonas oleovorans TaxID=301 RepID=UPI0019D05414|nr:retention module-containing protein [Pseudomonas oleovorans]MBN7118994.1 hypothetical protein [Pseudomonas oleovorans]MBN7133358.1 hypothetical protein [Pseudomonas oleovorans]MBN7142381.1 hypothetical protein [Pseudomonas oleovorans]
MATLIGVVSQVVGEVFAVASDGSRRPISEGDRVYAGEQLVTGAAGAVAIAMTNGQQLTLGRDSSMTLDAQMLASSPTSQAPTADAPPPVPSDSDLTDVERLQAAIEAGVDPTLEGEATAAGPGAGGGAGGVGGGHSFVLLGEVGGALDPVIGFPTEGLSTGPEFPDPSRSSIRISRCRLGQRVFPAAAKPAMQSMKRGCRVVLPVVQTIWPAKTRWSSAPWATASAPMASAASPGAAKGWRRWESARRAFR